VEETSPWSVNLKEYIDQRVDDVEKRAILRAEAVATQAIETKSQQLLAREIFNQFSARSDKEFDKLARFVTSESFGAISGRFIKELDDLREELHAADRRITEVQSKLSDELGKLRVDILGKEAFNTFVAHNDADLSNIRNDFKEAELHIAQIRESAYMRVEHKEFSDRLDNRIGFMDTERHRIETLQVPRTEVDIKWKATDQRFDRIETAFAEFRAPKYGLWVSFAVAIFIALSGAYAVVIRPLETQLETARRDINEQAKTASAGESQINKLSEMLSQHMKEHKD
jgi:hypothetical protein